MAISDPSNRRFLLRSLVALFVLQWVIVFVGVGLCTFAPQKQGALTDRCPDLGQRAETLFTMSITAVLSLLTNISD